MTFISDVDCRPVSTLKTDILNIIYTYKLLIVAVPFFRHSVAVELAKPSPVDSMREAVFTVSPNRQYLGIACPTTPACSMCNHNYNRFSQSCAITNTGLIVITCKTYENIPIVDSTKVLCPFFDGIETLISGDSPSVCPSLEKCELLMTSLKQFIKLEWMRTGVMSIPPFHECFKSSR